MNEILNRIRVFQEVMELRLDSCAFSDVVFVVEGQSLRSSCRVEVEQVIPKTMHTRYSAQIEP